MKIQYKTQNIPAPYSFEIEVDLKKSKSLEVAFDLTYTERGELDEDEILGEGFSGDDDIHWKGTLPMVWSESLDELVEKTTWTKKISKLSRCRIYVTPDDGTTRHPADTDRWEYWLQELQQACTETAGIEKPLELDLVTGAERISLKGSFKNREATVQNHSAGDAIQPVPWRMIRKVLKHIYIAEYYPEDALEKYDTKGDIFLHLGGGQWYNLSKANLHLDKKQNWLDQLVKIFNDLLSDPSA